MSYSSIKVNDIELNIATGKAMTFQGIHSGKILSGITLDFAARGQRAIANVERLLGQETVVVEDPFAARSYRASIRMMRSTWQEGKEERYYVAEVRELDMPPEYEILEIEGEPFPVLKHTQRVWEDDVTTRLVLLRLTKEQLLKLRRLLKQESVQVKRVGVDEQPLAVRLGVRYWSEHQEGDGTFYKQIMYLLPSDFTPDKGGLALSTDLRNTTSAVLALSARVEALLDDLVKANIISDERRSLLLGENWAELIDAGQLDRRREELSKVPDAEDEFLL